MKIFVLGAGAWGTALAVNASARHQVGLWARDAAQCALMRSQRENARYLPGIALPPSLAIEHFDASAWARQAAQGDLFIVATPMSGLRPTLELLRSATQPVAWLCKGFELPQAHGHASAPALGLMAHEVCAQVAPKLFAGALSGPSFALEVARGLPTALTLASNDGEFSEQAAQALHHARLRIYSSTDVVGVEVGGAVKNVLAIAAGIADGMGFGHNARAALITRGLAEMSRLGLKMGGQAETLGGLSGAGDLILTCTGDLSRNRQVGIMLAQKHSLPNILQQLGHVAEGVYTAREVHKLAQRLAVDMPICTAVYRVLHEQMSAASAVENLLSRSPNSEFN